jgi:hypothetical protein
VAVHAFSAIPKVCMFTGVSLTENDNLITMTDSVQRLDLEGLALGYGL